MLSDFQRDKLDAILRKLKKLQICSPFLSSPGIKMTHQYVDQIGGSNSLDEVSKKLSEGRYQTLESFRDDVRNIFETASQMGGNDLLSHIAREANQYFLSKFCYIPRNPDEESRCLIRKYTEKMYRYVNTETSHHPRNPNVLV